MAKPMGTFAASSPSTSPGLRSARYVMPSCFPSAASTSSSVTARILTSTSPMRPPSFCCVSSACASSAGVSGGDRPRPRRPAGARGRPRPPAWPRARAHRDASRPRCSYGTTRGGRGGVAAGGGVTPPDGAPLEGAPGGGALGGASEGMLAGPGAGRSSGPDSSLASLFRMAWMSSSSLWALARRAVDLLEHAALAAVVDGALDVVPVLAPEALDELAALFHLPLEHVPQVRLVVDDVRRERDDEVRLHDVLRRVPEEEAQDGDVAQDSGSS